MANGMEATPAGHGGKTESGWGPVPIRSLLHADYLLFGILVFVHEVGIDIVNDLHHFVEHIGECLP